MKRGSVGLRAIGAAALLVGGLGLGGSFPAAAAAKAPCQPTEGFTHCKIFDHSGAAVDFQVPAGIAELDFRAWGMGGDGNGFATGGNGAYVGGSLEVTPGEHLTVNVGGWRAGRGKLFGDALGGKAGQGNHSGSGGASTAVRAADGSPLFIAAGGGGGGYGNSGLGPAGSGGAPEGFDAAEDFGGKGAKGGQGGGAGGEGGKPGADQAQGGAGGDGGARAGGGGAGYAGGGGGGGRAVETDGGSGGGGSSYVDPERTSDVRLVSSTTPYPAAKDDPFWVHDPLDELQPDIAGVGQGGWNERGGDGRVVFQWKDPKGAPVVTELSRESGDDQTIPPNFHADPMVVVARNKDGEPLPDQKVTFTLEDPNDLGVEWQDEEKPTVEVWTDAQGRARTPDLVTHTKEGGFTVLATSGTATTRFTARVGQTSHVLEITGGDEQQAKTGEAFAEPLTVKVTKGGDPAADTRVEFAVEGEAEGAPAFDGDEDSVSVSTDAYGEASAPELIAGQEPGTYSVVATVGEATTRFSLEVVEEDATLSPSPSPSGGSDTTTGGSNGTDGTDTQGDSGSLALTGAAGIGTLAGAAAALVGLGWAATRLRKRTRTQD
ncbi:glycine-rich protein [Streptomyces sp. NPDC003635]